MSRQHDKSSVDHGESAVESVHEITSEILPELLRHADVRKNAPEAAKQRIKIQLKAQWRQKNNQRKKRNIWLASGSFATAFSVLMLLIVSGQMFSDNQTAKKVLLARTQGEVKTSLNNSGDLSNATDLLILPAGTMIETLNDGLATLILQTGGNLRLHNNSQLIINENNEFTLAFGTVYFDSGQDDLHSSHSKITDSDNISPQLGAITIKTLHGNIQDIGTQFQVSSNKNTLQVSVREGLINLHNQQGTQVVNQGFQLIGQSSGSFEKIAISPQDPTWQWVNEAAPKFSLEGKSLHQFLVWITREHGLTLYFSQKHTEKLSQFIILHGEIEGLTLEQALNTVFATTELTYSIVQNKLKVIR
ncbi:MAG: hypothetical protein ACI9LM_001584 [Alteromonadaceae bacterium]|jgi:hypothetical protein